MATSIHDLLHTLEQEAPYLAGTPARHTTPPER
jgi:hypothetical protein